MECIFISFSLSWSKLNPSVKINAFWNVTGKCVPVFPKRRLFPLHCTALPPAHFRENAECQHVLIMLNCLYKLTVCHLCELDVAGA
jgi:hypothetical protein